MKADQPGLPVTVALAFSAVAAPVLTGQAGMRENLRAPQVGMQAQQTGPRTKLRAGQPEPQPCERVACPGS